MISKKLKNLFLISIPIFIAHGLEEYFTNFYTFDPVLFKHLGDTTKELFIIAQVGLIVLALIIYYFLLNRKPGFMISILWGVLLILEFEHLYRAISLGGYTPGLITGLLFIPLNFFYWKEFLINWRKLNT